MIFTVRLHTCHDIHQYMKFLMYCIIPEIADVAEDEFGCFDKGKILFFVSLYFVLGLGSFFNFQLLYFAVKPPCNEDLRTLVYSLLVGIAGVWIILHHHFVKKEEENNVGCVINESSPQTQKISS